MICRNLTDANFAILTQPPDDITDEAADLLAAAVMAMLDAVDMDADSIRSGEGDR